MEVEKYLKREQAVRSWAQKVLQITFPANELLNVTLKSGVVLCYLMLEIDKSLIPIVHGSNPSPFKQRENIAFFLAGCKEFGLPDWRTFRENDLIMNHNIVNVVECLFALAEEANKKGKVTLSIKTEEERATVKKLSPQEEKDLKGLIARVRGPRKLPGKTKMSAVVARKALELKLGKDVDRGKLEQDVIRFQAVARGYLARKRYTQIMRDAAYRANVAKEIMTTEESYVGGLSAAIDIFMIPLQQSLGKGTVYTERNISEMFSTLPAIRTANASFLKKIKERVENWGPQQKIADLFLDVLEFLDCYNPYIKNFNHAVTMYDTLYKSDEFADWCKAQGEANAHITKGLDLPSYLIMPVQRFPRYILLLSDMLKRTWPQHRDFEELHIAVEKLGTVAKTLNEEKGKAERFTTLLNISGRFGLLEGFNPLNPSLSFVAEFNCVASTTSKKFKSKPMTIILYDCYFVACFENCKKEQKKLDVFSHIPLQYLKLNDLPDTKKEKNVFEILDKRGGKSGGLRLFWESGEAKTKGMKEIRDLLDGGGAPAPSLASPSGGAAMFDLGASVDAALPEQEEVSAEVALARRKKGGGGGGGDGQETNKQASTFNTANESLGKTLEALQKIEMELEEAEKKKKSVLTAQSEKLNLEIVSLRNTLTLPGVKDYEQKNVLISIIVPEAEAFTKQIISVSPISTVESLRAQCHIALQKKRVPLALEYEPSAFLLHFGECTSFLELDRILLEFIFIRHCLQKNEQLEVCFVLGSNVKRLTWIGVTWAPQKKEKKEKANKGKFHPFGHKSSKGTDLPPPETTFRKSSKPQERSTSPRRQLLAQERASSPLPRATSPSPRRAAPKFRPVERPSSPKGKGYSPPKNPLSFSSPISFSESPSPSFWDSRPASPSFPCPPRPPRTYEG